MRALVTGATGFVGGHLVDALLAAGDRVTALVRSPAKASGLANRGVQLVAGDLEQPAALEAAAREQEVIYHCAGLVAARDEAGFLAVNRDGVANLLAAATRVSRAHFVLVSSLAAAGPVRRGARRRGDETPEPVTQYGRSKLAGEQVLRAGALPWTIVRPPAVYGPRDREFLRVFKAVGWRVVPVFGDGRQELSLVYAPDLAASLAAVGRAPAAAGRVFYPAHPEVITSRALLSAVARAMGTRVAVLPLPRWLAAGVLGVVSLGARLGGRVTLLTPDKAHEFFAPAWTADPAPLESATGWRARTDLADGAAATAAWYQEAGWL